MIDKRSRERAREHAPHGWAVDTVAARTTDDQGRTLMRCPCGWLGWVFR